MYDCPPLIIECSLLETRFNLCWVLGIILPHSSYKDKLKKMHDVSHRVVVAFDSQLELSRKEYRASEDWSIYLLSWTMQTFVGAWVVLRKLLLVGSTVCVAAVFSKLHFLIYEYGLVIVLFISGKAERCFYMYFYCVVLERTSVSDIGSWWNSHPQFFGFCMCNEAMHQCCSMLTSLCIGLAIALVSDYQFCMLTTVAARFVPDVMSTWFIYKYVYIYIYTFVIIRIYIHIYK